jgi:hypothetical protein
MFPRNLRKRSSEGWSAFELKPIGDISEGKCKGRFSVWSSFKVCTMGNTRKKGEKQSVEEETERNEKEEKEGDGGKR